MEAARRSLLRKTYYLTDEVPSGIRLFLKETLHFLDLLLSPLYISLDVLTFPSFVYLSVTCLVSLFLQVLKNHLLLFQLPQQNSELGFSTYEQLPPIRARRLESIVGIEVKGGER